MEAKTGHIPPPSLAVPWKHQTVRSWCAEPLLQWPTMTDTGTELRLETSDHSLVNLLLIGGVQPDGSGVCSVAEGLPASPAQPSRAEA